MDLQAIGCRTNLRAFALGTLWILVASGAPASPPYETCAVCHEDLLAAWEGTLHGRIAEHETHGLGIGCATCHGDLTEHAESGDPELIRGLGPETPREDVAQVCTACHRSGALHDWDGSEHALAGVGCTDCHAAHVERGLEAKQPEMCWDCHLDVRAQFAYPSHHPVREGHMTCASCHDPHGGSAAMAAHDERPAERCLACHTQYTGPFLFEHEPVQEGCETCHAPHGAVANNLLIQNEPFLCLQCHEFHFHAGLEGNEEFASVLNRYLPDNGATDGEVYPDGAVPNPFRGAGYKRAFTTKCTQCHSAVHGTDLPSQTVSGAGSGLTR